MLEVILSGIGLRVRYNNLTGALRSLLPVPLTSHRCTIEVSKSPAVPLSLPNPAGVYSLPERSRA